MSRYFYLSTRLDREREIEPLLQKLTTKGWKRTYVWSAGAIAEEERPAIASAEIEGIRKADVVIIMLPGGRGTHAELGAALAFGKPVVLHSPSRKELKLPYPCVFHYHPSVRLFVSKKVDVDAILRSVTQDH